MRLRLIAALFAASLTMPACPSMEAQDDGIRTGTVPQDTVSTVSPLPMPLFYRPPQFKLPALGYQKQNALSYDWTVRNGVMKSMNHNLGFHRFHPLTEKMSEEWAKAVTVALYIAAFFLTPQFSAPPGCVQMGTTQFQYVKTPGWGPEAYSGMYSPENIPQCIRTEYDSSTGTYKQVMVDWNIVQDYRYNLHPVMGIDVKPVPTMHFNAVEKQVFGQ